MAARAISLRRAGVNDSARRFASATAAGFFLGGLGFFAMPSFKRKYRQRTYM